MNSKTPNLVVAGLILGLVLLAGTLLYQRGKQAARAETAEIALESLQQAYKRLQTASREAVAADAAAETVRVALRAPVEPAVTRFITLTDTLAYTDTVIVEAAREAVTTCTLALFGCEARLATADSVRAGLEAQVANLEAQLRATRSVAGAACSGTVPAWTLPVSLLGGAALGAWVRGD